MKRKVTIVVGLLALLLGVNMQVNALNPADGMVDSVKKKTETKHVGTQESIDEWMPDKNLQRALVMTMGLKETSELTQEALRSYTGNITIGAAGINNIKGLEYAQGTSRIDLGSNNSISDLSPLATLTQLKKLDVSFNSQIRDLSPLKNLNRLEELDVSSNAINNLTPLTNLSNLKYLNIRYNNVQYLTPLKGMRSLKQVEADMQKINYNEAIGGDVSSVIKQKNNIMNIDKSKPVLKAVGSSAKNGVYDKVTETMNWTYSESGKKIGVSTFDDASTIDGVTVKFSGTINQPIIVGDLTTIEVKDSTIELNSKWEKQDNFVKATDQNGEDIEFSKVMVEGSVNTSKPGINKVTYSVLNRNNEKVSKEATITVQSDQTTLEVKDSKLYIGDSWKAADNFVKATDKNGKAININDVSVEGSVNTSKEGSYKVKYTILNGANEKVTKEATITVKEDKTSVHINNNVIYVGDTWKPEYNLDRATDKDGKELGIEDVIVEGEVDTSKEGTYPVKYSVLNHKQEKVTATALVGVTADKTSIEVEKSTRVYLGDTWKPEDSFIKATDKDGNPLAFSEVKVLGDVDTSKIGEYQVIYYIPSKYKDVRATANIHVTYDETSLELKNTTIYLGDKWNPQDNIVKATKPSGVDADLDDITIEGSVDTSKEGISKVRYTILTHKNEKISREATITVKKDQTSLEVKDSQIYVGNEWSAADNFVKATDKDGNEVRITGIKVEGKPDTSKEGTNKVKYTIFNHADEKISKEATIIVKKDQTSIEVKKNTTLYVGDTWKPEDNFVKATDADGNPLDFSEVTVEGSVDTSKKGTYDLKYIVQTSNITIWVPVRVTVKEDQTSIKVKDSTMYIGDFWKSEDNFVSATDKTGKPIGLTNVNVEGDVSTVKESTNTVIYSVLNNSGKKVSANAIITVKKDQTNIEVKDSTLYIGDSWKAADNFVEAVDKDGKAINFDDVTTEGEVNTDKAGVYKVKYSVLSHLDRKVSKEATITVKEDLTSIEVKDSMIYVGDKWKPEDNLVKATDKDGKAIAIDGITVEGKVDTSKEDISFVKYTISNHKNEKITKTASITVVANLTSIEVKDSTLYLGDTWSPEDNLVKATDADGKPVGIDKIEVKGSVDTSKEGIYEVEYSLNTGQAGANGYAKITVKKDETNLEVKDSTLYSGDKWNPEDNVVKAIDQDGKDISIKDIMVEGKADTSKEGVNKVKYTILDHKGTIITKEATITVKVDQTSIEVKDSQLYVGDKWQDADNFVKAVNKDGQAVDLKWIEVSGSVDTSKEGVNKVTYSVPNHAGTKVSKEATITVKKDLTSIEVKDSTLYSGDTWNPEDNVVKAIDQDGKDISIKDIMVEGSVDPTVEGIYKVKYTILNHFEEKISHEATITVKGNDLTALEVKGSVLYLDDKWNPQDNIVKALNPDGKKVDIDDIKIEGEVNTAREGEYQVKFTIFNHKQDPVTRATIVKVKEDLTSLEVKDSRVYLNGKWNPANNLVEALDKDGKSVGIAGVTVEGDVDSSKEDVYKVKYTILNHKNEEISKEATITVKGIDLTSIEVKDSTLYQGDSWKAEDNFVKATDKDGKDVGIKDITVEGDVDVTEPATYKVIYTILNHGQEKISKTATITVKGIDLTSLEVKDSTLYFGDRWEPEDNLVKATDADGNPLDIYDVKVEGNVDIKTAGEYPVKYTVLNHAKEEISKVATITIKGHDLTYLEVEDSTLYIDDKWNPADNLIKARDKDGNELGIDDVIIEGEVDTSKEGTYEVVYALLNHNNEKLSNIVTVTVKKDQTSLKVKNSAIYLDDQWNPADNLVEAIDQDGKNIDVKDITIDSNVDTSKTGIYRAKYTILNHKQERLNRTATIIVKKDQTSVEVKDSKLYLSDTWHPEDNLVKAVDKDGKDVTIKNIKVTGKVDTSQVGVYQITYTIFNHRKEKVSAVATISVKEDQTRLIVKDSELYRDDEWNPADNIVEAIDQDGNVIEDIAIISPQSDDQETAGKVIIEGNVDTRQEGVSKLTYTIFDHAKTKITKEVAINVKVDQTSLQVKNTKISLNSKWQPANNLVRATDQDGKTLNIKDVTVKGKVNTHKAGKYQVTYTLMNHAEKKISKKATITVQKKNNGNGNGSGKDGNGKLPKTGYDMSIIGSLLGLAGVLGLGSLYLSRKERKE